MSGNAMLTMNRSRLDRNAAAEVTSRTAPGRAVLMAFLPGWTDRSPPGPRRGGLGRAAKGGGATPDGAGSGGDESAGEVDRRVGGGVEAVVEAVAVGRLEEEP